MTITIHFPPDVEKLLRASAAAKGKDLNAVVVEAVEKKLREEASPLAEILAPLHDEFRQCGMAEDELRELLTEELAEARRQRQREAKG